MLDSLQCDCSLATLSTGTIAHGPAPPLRASVLLPGGMSNDAIAALILLGSIPHGFGNRTRGVISESQSTCWF